MFCGSHRHCRSRSVYHHRISVRSHVMTADIQRSMLLCEISGSGAILDVSSPSNITHFIPPDYREGQGFILVYSIASRATFERLEVFRQAMLKVKRQRPVFMLVGNKCDKQYEREVSREEGAAMARDFGCRFLETSAKTAQNVEKLFTDLVRLLRSSKESVDRGVPPPPPPTKPPKQSGRIKCVIL